MIFFLECSLESINMQFVKQVNILSHNTIIKTYSEVFTSIALVNKKCSFVLQPSVWPIIEPPREISFWNEVPKKGTTTKRYMITPIEDRTDWVNSVILVEKTNDQLHMCLDSWPPNKAICRGHYPFHNVQTCKAR